MAKKKAQPTTRTVTVKMFTEGEKERRDLRDAFAGMVLNAVFANDKYLTYIDNNRDLLVRHCYSIADAMLIQREAR